MILLICLEITGKKRDYECIGVISPQLGLHITMAENLCSFLDKEGFSDVVDLTRERYISAA